MKKRKEEEINFNIYNNSFLNYYNTFVNRVLNFKKTISTFQNLCYVWFTSIKYISVYQKIYLLYLL